jgi:hypothetical protein
VLALAGLLRPEAWILSAAYALYVIRSGRDGRARLIALAAAGPIVWGLHDLLATGDPLFSLQGTRHVAEISQRESGIGAALRLAPRFVRELAGVAVACGGVAAWLLVPAGRQRRIALPAALFGLSVASFLAYGVAGLTLYARFLLPAAAVLALLCAAGIAGYGGPIRHDRPRLAAAVAIGAAVLVSLPFTISDLADVRSGSETRARLERSLERLAGAHRARIANCHLVQVPTRRVVPPLSRLLDIPKERFKRTETPAPDTLYVGLPPGARRDYAIDPLRPDPVPSFSRTTPPAARSVAANADWALRAEC